MSLERIIVSSPAEAINYGVDLAKGDVVGIMIDGARMVTPGVLHYIFAAYQISTRRVVAVPGYHLGRELQKNSVENGYDEDLESQLLKQINWPENGYELFEISCFSGSCRQGFFLPMAESNCLCLPKDVFLEIGGCESRFDLPGGGAVNLDLYKRVCELPDMDLVILFGEGTFHQYHGGVTTGHMQYDAQEMIRKIFAQYEIDSRRMFQITTKAGGLFRTLG